MKYSEFREYLNLKRIPMEEDEERLIVFYHIEISKTEEHRIEFLTTIIEYLYECEMLKKAFELAETPLDEREEEKKYYLKHRFISDLTVQKYINIDVFGEVTIRDYYGNQNNKTKFTKAEIEELEEKFDIDLSDFELIEVED